MNIVTASFNTTMRQMTKMSHDQNVSAKNDRNVSEKKTAPLSSGVFRSLNQGTKLSRMLEHTAILSILVVMAECFSILLIQHYVWCEICLMLFRFRPAFMQLGGLPLATGAHPLGWCALRLERAVGWHLILRPKLIHYTCTLRTFFQRHTSEKVNPLYLYTADVFPKACNVDKIWAPECIAEKVKFAFCSASIVSRECSIGSIFAFSVEQKFTSCCLFSW